ncbi:MAG: SDR family NAD(P)-dependent oxidoreductase [Bacteroidota bacterium]
MILLTGATGFLGQHLLQELLTAGYEVRTLVRNEKNRNLPWRKMVDVVEGDVLDLLALDKALEGVDTVVHAAAFVSFWKKKKEQVMKVNVEGTANLVNLCLEKGVGRILHVSSIAAIGRNKKGINTEETPWNREDSVSTYSISKREAEYEIYRGIGEGLQAQIINPGLILGPTDNWENGTGQIFSTVYKGLKVYKGGSDGMVGVKDVARSCSFLLGKDVPNGERYILVGENWAYHDLLKEIAIALGKNPPSMKIPAWVANTGGLLNEWLSAMTGKEPGITLEAMRSSNAEDSYDGSKITRLGFEYTPIKDVIKETAEAFLQKHTS